MRWIAKCSSSFFFHQRRGNKRSLQCFTTQSQGYLGKCHSVRSNTHLPTLFSHFNVEDWAQAARQQQTQGQEINLFFMSTGCSCSFIPELICHFNVSPLWLIFQMEKKAQMMIGGQSESQFIQARQLPWTWHYLSRYLYCFECRTNRFISNGSIILTIWEKT